MLHIYLLKYAGDEYFVARNFFENFGELNTKLSMYPLYSRGLEKK